MAWDFADYSGEDSTPSLPLFLSERSQQLLLAVIKSMQSQYAWITDDYDLTDAAVSEAVYELSNPVMPDFTPVGTVMWYVGLDTTIPEKWLIADGSLLDVDDYPALAAIVRADWIVSGNIVLPDLRERFLYGAGINGDIGNEAGESEHTLTTSELPAHAHDILRRGALTGATTALDIVANSVTPTLAIAGAGLAAGGGNAHNNMPPYSRGWWMIKVLP